MASGTVSYKAGPSEEVYFIEECNKSNSPVLIRGTVYRIDIVVSPTLDPVAPNIKIKYLVRTSYSQQVVLENPSVYDADLVAAGLNEIPVVTHTFNVFPLVNKAEAIEALEKLIA